MRARLTRLTGRVAGYAGSAIRTLPGVAAGGCGTVGADLLWGTGWAWLTAAGFLLLLALEVN